MRRFVVPLLGAAALAAAIPPACVRVGNDMTCTVVGPEEGAFSFERGVSSFTLLELSSGKGGDSPFFGTDGGWAVEVRGSATFDIDPNEQYSMQYNVGGNGEPGTTNFDPWDKFLPRNNGPPDAGDGFGPSGSGGSGSYLPDQDIYLGGGGGAAWLGDGGSAGFGPAGRGLAGSDGWAGSRAGKGGSAVRGEDVIGGRAKYQGYPANGKNATTPLGGTGWRGTEWKGCGGGGGSSAWSAGSGGAQAGSGGGGASYVGVANLTLVPKKDPGQPRLVFRYALPTP